MGTASKFLNVMASKARKLYEKCGQFTGFIGRKIRHKYNYLRRFWYPRTKTKVQYWWTELKESEGFNWYATQLAPVIMWNGIVLAFLSKVFIGTSFDPVHILGYGFVYYYGKVELFDRLVQARKNVKINGRVKVDD